MNEWSGSVYWWTGVFTVSELTLRDSWCCLLGELLSVSLPEHKIGRLHQVPNSKYIHLFCLCHKIPRYCVHLAYVCFTGYFYHDESMIYHGSMTTWHIPLLLRTQTVLFFLLVAEVTASSDCQSIKWVRDSVRFFWEIKNSMLSVFRCPQAC